MTMPMRTACPATHSHNSSYDGACAVSVWYLCTVTRESRGIPRTTHSPGTQPSVKGPVCKCGLCSSSSTTSTAVLRTVAVCSVTRAKLPFAKMVYSCSAGSCANARASARWPIAPWSMHRARHQRVAFARPSAHASAPPLSTPPCHPDARGTVYTELSVSSMVYVGISYVIDERMNKTCPKEPSSRVLSKR